MKIRELKADENFYGKPDRIAARWGVIINDIRKQNLNRQDAIDSLYVFTNQLWDFLNGRIEAGIIRKYTDEEWVFPVRGYGPSAIGGRNGSGYIVGGFDFFDGSTGGHPAHDIFINDRDQDSRDDNTGLPVEILSMTGGIVIETRKNWTTENMDIKGGNIVYVYDNYTNGLFYYAHLEDVFVDVGDYVSPGKPLGTMGRTGKNAFPSRSPTHLHLMYVRSFDGELLPENIYSDLINAKIIY
ncbi:MAG TPA: peptidase M23 [Bacteroidetes bacterium]|nr:peptidase M23 [Bacteroidota bacterium]HRK00805.1 M23 family metallopeptidase [Ignavibacteria bacterium]